MIDIDRLRNYLDDATEAEPWLRSLYVANPNAAHANLARMATQGVTLDLLAQIGDQLAAAAPGLAVAISAVTPRESRAPAAPVNTLSLSPNVTVASATAATLGAPRVAEVSRVESGGGELAPESPQVEVPASQQPAAAERDIILAPPVTNDVPEFGHSNAAERRNDVVDAQPQPGRDHAGHDEDQDRDLRHALQELAHVRPFTNPTRRRPGSAPLRPACDRPRH